MSCALIQLHSVTKFFASHPVFKEISLSIHEGDRMAFIGENGCGKTTFLKLLKGEISSDTGSVTRSPLLTMGYLPQEIQASHPSARVFLQTGLFEELERQMDFYLAENRLLDWGESHQKYERLGGYHRLPIEPILRGLKLEDTLLDAPFYTLSSGQRVRFALAKCLMENPTLLLLDEPTNHLDQLMIGWLKEILKARRGATVVVSHDRAFINSSCTTLIELQEGKLTYFTGTYDEFLVEKEEAFQRQLKAYEVYKEERKELEAAIKAEIFSKKKKAPSKDNNKMAYDKRGEQHQKSSQRHINILKEKLQEMESLASKPPKPTRIQGLQFNTSWLSNSPIIELENLSVHFGEKTVLNNLNKQIFKGDRLVIQGQNGCGKTTLLQCIFGCLPYEGVIRKASEVKMSFLDQESQMLPSETIPLAYFQEKFFLSEEELWSRLHQTGLRGADLLMRPLHTLSTGQRKRLMLLALLLEKPNVLLLDEPTNHLDLGTMEALEKALMDFEGVILAVSHDRRFISKIANQTWNLIKV